MVEFEDYNVTEVVGMDIEPEDTDVGIFGPVYYLGFKTEEGKELTLTFGYDEISALLTTLKPVIDEEQNKEDLDKLLRDSLNDNN
jgi:hypothetical protein